MKKALICSMAILVFLCAKAQKFNETGLEYNYTHLPEKLIYDQIKTYGVSILVNPSNVFTLDYNFAMNSLGALSSYNKVAYADADMQIYATFGPYTQVEEKTISRSVSEVVNKVTVNTTVYKRQLTFKYPITYKVANRKNGANLYYNEYSNTYNRIIESAEYKSEQEAVNIFNGERATKLAADINGHVNSFCGNSVATVKDQFDFYPKKTSIDLMQFKKWDKDEEYNDHLKSIKKIISVMSADENPALYVDKLKDDINYLKQFEGQFKPNDKKEDVLYFGNYYNLSTIYIVLDDYEKARYYLQKLDSCEKKDSYIKFLKSTIDRNTRRMNRHYLTMMHMNYNPVSDFRLAGKNFTSDAMSSAELLSKSVEGGAVVVNDEVVTVEGKTIKGKIYFEKETGLTKILPTDKAETFSVINAVTCTSFIKDSLNYVSAKEEGSVVTKNLYLVRYQSNKVKLLQQIAANFVGLDRISVIKPTDNVVNVLAGLGLKKSLVKYFADCPTVSEKIQNGDFTTGAFATVAPAQRLEKYIEMCKQYSDCK